MANTSVLDPFSIKPREQDNNKVHPRNQVGGTMEYVEGALDLIFKGPEGLLVNEPPSLEQISQMPEHRVGSAFIDGTMANFQKPRGIEDVYPEIGDKRIDEQIAEQFNIWRKSLARADVEQRRTKINELNNFDPSYLGTMDEEGNVNKYHQSEADKKEYADIGFSIQQQKAKQLEQLKPTGRKTSSKAAVSGANDLLLNAQAQEGQSMTSSASAVRSAG